MVTSTHEFLQESIQRDRVRRDCMGSFYDFINHAWPHVDPRPYHDNWHIYVMCEYLQRFAHSVMRSDVVSDPINDPINNLIINIPPGHAKSLVASVLFPAWCWLHYPSAKFLCSAHSASLSTRDSVRCRDLLRSEWYQQTFKPSWSMKNDQDEKTYYVNTTHGWRFSLGVGSKVIGWRPNFHITDDPLDATDSTSSLKRAAVNEWYDNSMSTRLQNLTAGHLLIMQRLHEDDLVGHLLRTRGNTYEHLCLQAEYDPYSLPSTANRLFYDPRRPGDLLFPTIYNATAVGLLKRALGSFGSASQLQQSPVPREGGFFKLSWFKRYAQHEIHPEDFTEVIQSWDCAVEGEAKNDRVSGQLWGKVRSNHPKYPNHFVLYDAVCENADFVKNLSMIRTFSLKHPYAQTKLIEKKANGAPIIQLLKNELRDSHVIPFDPKSRSKEVRASAVSPVVEAGLVCLPTDSSYVGSFIEEITSFPRGKHDDQVDAFTQALLHFTQTNEWVYMF